MNIGGSRGGGGGLGMRAPLFVHFFSLLCSFRKMVKIIGWHLPLWLAPTRLGILALPLKKLKYNLVQKGRSQNKSFVVI